MFAGLGKDWESGLLNMLVHQVLIADCGQQTNIYLGFHDLTVLLFAKRLLKESSRGLAKYKARFLRIMGWSSSDSLVFPIWGFF